MVRATFAQPCTTALALSNAQGVTLSSSFGNLVGQFITIDPAVSWHVHVTNRAITAGCAKQMHAIRNSGRAVTVEARVASSCPNGGRAIGIEPGGHTGKVLGSNPSAVHKCRAFSHVGTRSAAIPVDPSGHRATDDA